MLRYKIFIILAALTVFIIFFGIVFLLFLNPGKKEQGNLPTPTPVTNGAVPGVRNTSADTEYSKKSFIVGGLVSELPHYGKNFSLYYRYNTAQFILYINPLAVSEGNTEFDIYLKQNGIEDRSWIENLVTTSQN